jgi:outer membrane biosynthesis protein TonB
MKLPRKSVAFLLPLVLAACSHKTNQTQVQPLAPPIDDSLPKPVPSPTNLPPPEISVPTPASSADSKPAEQTPPPKPPVRHRKPVNKNTQQASNGASVSAIGQLSSGDSSDLRSQTANSIAATERGLNGITRPLNDAEQKTATHIREFLKQARTALDSGDIDGAQTLAAKAKVLLGEIGR